MDEIVFEWDDNKNQINIRKEFLLRVGFFTLEKPKRPGLGEHRPCDIAIRKVNIFHS